MTDLAKFIIILGVVLILAGLVLLYAGKIPFFGKLPGDFLIRKKNFTFYFPLTTGIIISILVTLILFLVRKFK
jgi:ribose/xylose/arabinose/galactoside ABC-type transport system permease subunit